MASLLRLHIAIARAFWTNTPDLARGSLSWTLSVVASLSCRPMEAFLPALVAALVAGLSAAAPWLIYAQRVFPSLRAAGARPAAYVVAAVPALLASLAALARLGGITTGDLRSDVVLLVAILTLASSWGPIVRGALALTGGPAYVPDSLLRTGMRPLAVVLAVAIFIATATWVVTPAYLSLRACMAAEAILAAVDPPPANPAPLPDSLPYNPPEPGALYTFSFPMNLEQAATSRHDEDTGTQLAAAGFVAGHMRAWYAADGRGIQADVFEFETPEGAAEYQAAVTRHACRYANEAFRAPMSGIGLQVRYGTGDPIVEQISWIAGNRRYLVQVSERSVPPDHGRILAILESATIGWPME
jgi:hypothetical protein